MTKIEWQRHVREAGKHDPTGCPDCQARRKTRQRNLSQRSRYQAYRSVGMVKTPYGWE